VPISKELHELPVTIGWEVIALRAFLDAPDGASRAITTPVGELNMQGDTPLNPRPQAIQSADFPILKEVREARCQLPPALLNPWDIGLTQILQNVTEIGGKMT